ncbi:MAG TPA: hypothetical protein VG603_13935 [Chitinophagales bacterium]|nr:hypothetical protein [Chitinophagales bacterium]
MREIKHTYIYTPLQVGRANSAVALAWHDSYVHRSFLWVFMGEQSNRGGELSASPLPVVSPSAPQFFMGCSWVNKAMRAGLMAFALHCFLLVAALSFYGLFMGEQTIGAMGKTIASCCSIAFGALTLYGLFMGEQSNGGRA